jgi:hypothetical protein
MTPAEVLDEIAARIAGWLPDRDDRCAIARAMAAVVWILERDIDWIMGAIAMSEIDLARAIMHLSAHYRDRRYELADNDVRAIHYVLGPQEAAIERVLASWPALVADYRGFDTLN